MILVANLAMWLALVPFAWLLVTRRDADRSWWWMAVGFGVSLLADVGGWLGYGREASQVYPLLQAAVFLLVLLPRRAVEWLVALCLVAVSASIALRHAEGLDVLLRVVAFGLVAVAAVQVKHFALRYALLTYFGGGTVAWLWYVCDPGWMTWGLLQGTRMVGIGAWCYAIRHEAPFHRRRDD